MDYKNIAALVDVIEKLKGDGGCPWDKKQTPTTMANYLIEEAYELADAVESGNPEDVCEELGDVLFLIFFIARLFQESGCFDIFDVSALNVEKMIRRHPHVFGNKKVAGEKEVRSQWHKIKMKEKNHKQKESVLNSVPVGLPALMRAYRISERAARTGFDWDDMASVLREAEGEWAEFQAELTSKKQSGNQDRIALEFGDVLFTLVNVARFARIHPETALTGSIKKFEKRFRHMERDLAEKGKSMEQISRNDIDILWEEAKKKTAS